jgi:hypothetical protein
MPAILVSSKAQREVRRDYTEVERSPFANEGSRQFIPSAANKSGEADWVLVLEAQTPH